MRCNTVKTLEAKLRWLQYLVAVQSQKYCPLQPNEKHCHPELRTETLQLLVLCLANSMTWPPLESLSLWHSAQRKSVSGAPAMLSLTRHPAVTSHTAACRHIVRCRQRQCHCQCYAQCAPTLLLTFTLSPSVHPSPGALAFNCSSTWPWSESKTCRKTPNSPHRPANQSWLVVHSNQTSFPRYSLLEI